MGYIPEISGDRIKDGGVELQDLAPGVAGFGSVPGVIVPFAGTVAPNGWLLCHGQLVSSSTYSLLFSTIGHTYNGGVDPGGGSFRLPDLRGRSPFGKDDMGGTDAGRMANNTLGGTGGVERANITLNEMPSHTHGGTTGNDSVDHSHAGTTNDINQNHTHSGSTGTVSSDHAHGLFHRNTTIGGSATGNDPVDYMFDPYTHGFTNNTPGITANHTHAFTTGTVSSGHTHGFTTGGRSAFHTHSFTTGAPTGYGVQTALSKMPPHLILNYVISTGEAYVAPANVAEMIPRDTLTQAGDMVVATGTGVEATLGAPTVNGSVLTASTSDPKKMTWQRPVKGILVPNATVGTNVTQASFPGGTWARMYGVNLYKAGSYFEGATLVNHADGAQYIQIDHAGVYMFELMFSGSIPSSAEVGYGITTKALYDAGTGVYRDAHNHEKPYAATADYKVRAFQRYCAVGDLIAPIHYFSGATGNVVHNNQASSIGHFSFVRVSP